MQAYSPLVQAKRMDDPTLLDVARKVRCILGSGAHGNSADDDGRLQHGRTPGQILIRCMYHLGLTMTRLSSRSCGRVTAKGLCAATQIGQGPPHQYVSRPKILEIKADSPGTGCRGKYRRIRLQHQRRGDENAGQLGQRRRWSCYLEPCWCHVLNSWCSAMDSICRGRLGQWTAGVHLIGTKSYKSLQGKNILTIILLSC